MAGKLDAHAMRLFLKAADARCEQLMKMNPHGSHRAFVDAQYEMARNELLSAIERAERQDAA